MSPLAGRWISNVKLGLEIVPWARWTLDVNTLSFTVEFLLKEIQVSCFLSVYEPDIGCVNDMSFPLCWIVYEFRAFERY